MITDTPVASKPTRVYHCRQCESRGVAGPDDPPALWVLLRTFRYGRRVLLGAFCSRACIVEYF